MFAGSFSRSMAASTVSVTPLPACVAGGVAFAFTLSVGQLPATAADTPTSVDPAVMPASIRCLVDLRPLATGWNMFVISSISPTRLGGCSGITIDQTFLQRKCRMALESIRGGYRGGAQCTQASSQIAMGSNYP